MVQDIRIRTAVFPRDRAAVDEIHYEAFECSHRGVFVAAEKPPWFVPEGTCFLAEVETALPQAEPPQAVPPQAVHPQAVPPVLAGFACVKYDESSLPWIDDIFVHPDFQSRGIGLQLMRHAEQFVKQNGETTTTLLGLCVFEADTRARKFYAERCGFELAEGKGFVCEVDGATYAVMEKRIRPVNGILRETPYS